MKKSILTVVAFLFLSCLAANASAGQVLKCEKRNTPQRSRLSVEVGNLAPGALFSARVSSGANSVTSKPAAADTLGVVRFDFDSKPADILAGATPVASNFIVGNAATTVTDALGTVVASASAVCTVK